MRRNYTFIAAAAVLLASGFAPANDQGAVVSWEALAQVTVTKQKDRYVPEFSKQIVECAFCMPGSAEQFAEVRTRTPVNYVTEPITHSGTFGLVRDESGGLLYRLNEATAGRQMVFQQGSEFT